MRIGIDLGGTKIVGGLIDDAGRVLTRKRVPTDAVQGYEGIVARIVHLIDAIIGESGCSRNDIERVGIASAGQIEKHSHRIVFSPNLGFHDVPIRDDLERALGIGIFVENDVNAAIYGEWKFGLMESPANVLGIFVGTGIGGGLILDGRIYRGFSNVGGEIGHMTVNSHGYPCHCGNTGCFEAYCGGYYIVERAKRRLNEGYRGKLWGIIGGDPGVLNTGHIEDAYLKGDEYCGEIWKEVVEHMGVGLASLVNILNPEMIVFGGGVVYGSKYLIDQAADVMRRRVMGPSLKGLRMERARLGEDSAIMGAAFIDE